MTQAQQIELGERYHHALFDFAHLPKPDRDRAAAEQLLVRHSGVTADDLKSCRLAYLRSDRGFAPIMDRWAERLAPMSMAYLSNEPEDRGDNAPVIQIEGGFKSKSRGW